MEPPAQSTIDYFTLVRQTTKHVVERARHIEWDLEKLIRFADSLEPQAILNSYSFDQAFYPRANGEQLLNYIVTLNAINFGSGLSEDWRKIAGTPSTFTVKAAALKKLSGSGKLLDAEFARTIDAPTLAKALGLRPDFELVTMFVKSLHEIGEFVSKQFGNYAVMFSEFEPDHRTHELVRLLFENLSLYHDRTVYQNLPVYFLKRAQILANDVYLAFGGKWFGTMHDHASLTMFADNLVPHFFRVEEILHYSDELADKIDRGIKFESGSEEEVEIRAFGVQCIEKLTERLVRKDPSLTAAMIDNYIWYRAQDQKYKSRPRHLTVTYFY